MRTRILTCILVAALGSRCGTDAFKSCSCSQAPPEKDWSKEVVFEDEPPWPPEPPEVYLGPWSARTEMPTLVEEAEEEFEKKNYETAMEKYRKFLEKDPKSFWVPHATFQISRCHYQRSEYDEALAALTKFVEDRPGTLWEARAKVKMSSLYHALPSYGYELDEKITYNYEHQEGEYRYLGEDNQDRAIEMLQDARLAYVSLVTSSKSGKSEGDDLRLEAVDAVFLLIRDLDARYWDKSDPCPPMDPVDPPDPAQLYDPNWSARQKLLYLYADVASFNAGRKDTHPVAWATFKKALFLMRYPECAPAEYLVKVEKQRKAFEEEKRSSWENKTGKKAEGVLLEYILDDLGEDYLEIVPFDPGPALDPLAVVQSVLDTYPDDRHRELYEATRGRILEGRSEFREAEKVYEAFVEAHPESVWVGDVQQSLTGMRRPTLSLGTGDEITYSGQDARVGVYTRNVDEVQIEIYEVNLQGQLLSAKRLKDPYARFSDVDDIWKDFAAARKVLKKKVWSTTFTTGDRDDYRSRSGSLVLPDDIPIGTYMIHAHTDQLGVLQPWIKTDMVIVGKAVKDEMRYVVADAMTGAPVVGAALTVKETYEQGWGWVTKVKVVKGVTDDEGRYTYRLTRGSDVSYNRVEILASREDSVAFTNTQSGPYSYSSDTGRTYRIFTVTDRPVYRPGDTVKFKHVIRAYENGKNVNEKNLDVMVTVRDPNYANLVEKKMRTGSFGTVFGEVEIPEDAPLGVYSAGAAVVGHEWRCYQSSGSTFRVEEYKKPEFEVKVLPGKNLARPGEEVQARITATYYFGAPVGEAKVSYKVYRSIFTHTYNPPNRWDWLYGPGFGIVWDRPYSAGENLVAEGEGLTDDLGEMVVKLPAVSEEEKYDYTYKVVAEVTDPTRRVISGEGSLKVTKDPYYVHMVPAQGFYTAGDRVELEIRALTPDDEPVPASGEVRVVQLVHRAAQEPEEKLVDERKLGLDEEGRAFYQFKAKDEGQYRVTYSSSHAGSKEVVGERVVNVAGAHLARKHFSFDEVEVTSQKRTYLRGETIDLLVQSPWEDATLWVTYEGGDEIFQDTIIRPEGMGAVLQVQATEELHPNFFVRVTAVHDGIVHTVRREIFIPPGEEILDVTVKLDRDEYQPRDKGKVRIEVKDHLGKPLEGEFSLSVFDSSVLYIQGETAGDIRGYYYGSRRYGDIAEFHSTQLYLYGYSTDGTSYPYFTTSGLPSTGGWFGEPYLDRGLYFTCPSCETKRTSPWIFELPEKKTGAVVVGSTGEATIGLGNLGTIGHGGGGGTGVGYGRGAGSLGMAKKAPSAAPKMKMARMEAASTSSYGILGVLDQEKSDMPDTAAGDYKPAEGEAAAPGDFVRENFADTALWIPDLVSDSQGRASTQVEWPDNLTTWAVRVFGVDGSSRVGIAKTEVVTTKKLVARIETPRFMIEGDVVTLAAVVNNDHESAKKVDLTLKVEGGVEVRGKDTATITVEPGKDARHDFSVLATTPGEITVTLGARTEGDSDAIKKTLEVMEWGSDRMVAQAGAMQAPGTMRLTLDLPEERRKDTTRFVLTMDPTVATVVLKSMPYLIHYPYGCVEQTMSRFLPAAMVARTLTDMQISLADIPKLADQATLADPVGRAHGAPQAWWNQPIYSDAKLKGILKQGLTRLYRFQHSDGGWGWWQDDRSDEYMTAYVLSGLVVAQEAGYDIDSYVIDRGMHFLKRRFDRKRNEVVKTEGWENLDPYDRHHLTYLAYVLSLKKLVRIEEVQGLWDHREALTHYGRALLALTMHNIDEEEKAKLAVTNLANVAWKDPQNGTASFKFENKQYWHWYNNRIESVAWALRAFTTIDPEHELGPMFARWLVKNREGNRWFSTKDTALSVLALTDYMRAHGELDPDYDVTVTVNGEKRLAYHVGKDDIFKGKGTLVLEGDEVRGDKVDIQVSTTGKGALYASSFLTYFTKEKIIKASGSEIAVERHYYKLHEVKKKVKTWYGEVTRVKYAREELAPGDEIRSGDLIEVKIVVKATNDFEYLVFEDYKPAGCEPTELKSGGIFEHGRWMNREMRDEKVVTFLPRLSQGEQIITYIMRAEIPGTFRVLPHNAYAMYAPRVKAISDSWNLVIAP